jgi:hypothetical protein
MKKEGDPLFGNVNPPDRIGFRCSKKDGSVAHALVCLLCFLLSYQNSAALSSTALQTV